MNRLIGISIIILAISAIVFGSAYLIYSSGTDGDTYRETLLEVLKHIGATLFYILSVVTIGLIFIVGINLII